MTESQTADTLSVRQHKALSAILSEPSIRKASEQCSVPERTLYQWLKTPAFADEYRSARREATQQAIARVQQFSGHAAATLVSLLDTRHSPAIRLAAASKILDIAIRTVDLEALEARLIAMEAHLAERL